MLTPAQALALAVHEKAHELVARLHGILALGMLHLDGEGVTYLERVPVGLPSRLISAAGPIAEYRLTHPSLDARRLWHAHRAGDLARYFSASDRLYAAPLTRRLLALALTLVSEHWPEILAAAEREARVHQFRQARALELLQAEQRSEHPG